MTDMVDKSVEGAALSTNANLATLRGSMVSAGLNALIIPTSDPHMSEYPAECFKRRQFISKFTGSAGTAIITEGAALLWTDGRYFLQASQELGPEWTLMRAGTPGVPDIVDWLAKELPAGSNVGIDPYVHTITNVKNLKSKLEGSGKQLTTLTGPNLVDEIWGDLRPSLPSAPLRQHPPEWAGETVGTKLERLRAAMKTAGADILLASMLDQVAWVTNLRGGDVECNPVFLSYLLLREQSATLYVDTRKVDTHIEATLKEAGVEIKSYEAILPDIQAAAAAGFKIWMDPAQVNYALFEAATTSSPSSLKRKAEEMEGSADTPKVKPAAGDVLELTNPIDALKCVKNEAELAGMREAHLRDAEALCTFLAWLEAEVQGGGEVSEVEIDEKLTALRAAQPGFVELSFPTIAGADANGAIVHYRAKVGTCRNVGRDTMLLLDSGGQYDCGTTDVTRTMHFGEPSGQQRRFYTLVLKGHIALDTAIFPEGTAGMYIDAMARMPLWKTGLNYLHSTGHGVGAALNVHEGPISISGRGVQTAGLAVGQIVSNEPGYYEDGAFGVRIENLVEIKEAQTEFKFGGVKYLCFQPVTLVPIQLKLVDASLLSAEEVQWLDSYHARVWEAVSTRVAHDANVTEWLRKSTRPLVEQHDTAAVLAYAALEEGAAGKRDLL